MAKSDHTRAAEDIASSVIAIAIGVALLAPWSHFVERRRAPWWRRPMHGY